ncbi:MAG: YbjQ family protein [Syntrophomonas sp.]|uniref:YbjQ family protein n=1 Tax=Syntrophomonas TaxID=862 RepID=UPI0007745503|nr:MULTISPECIES: YbjQ family protein [Syntrophomonas]MDD2509926.1 YbjQ family protein [Syntrophomonas sp.]MDD3879674.1 YbjQ family protein [Syntrophomonas sp.]MDD4626054.1 YbjQ family protein [Syntrophomonas sp.]
MLLVTTDNLSEYKISKTLGLVRGSSIRAKHLGRDIGAVLKSLVGGELKGYSELLVESREEALNRMIEAAEKLNADAIVGIRFSSSQIMSGAAEMLVYGTAVKIEK